LACDGNALLDANILIRSVLGQPVRHIFEVHAENISFFLPETAYAEAEEHLAALVVKRRGDPAKGLAALKAMAALATILGDDLYVTSKPKRGSASAHAIRRTGRFWQRPLLSTVRSGRNTPISSDVAPPGLLAASTFFSRSSSHVIWFPDRLAAAVQRNHCVFRLLDWGHSTSHRIHEFPDQSLLPLPPILTGQR